MLINNSDKKGKNSCHTSIFLAIFPNKQFLERDLYNIKYYNVR